MSFSEGKTKEKTLSMTTFSTETFSIKTFSLRIFNVRTSIRKDIQHKDTQHNCDKCDTQHKGVRLEKKRSTALLTVSIMEFSICTARTMTISAKVL
jgi:hypothetical protein